LYLRMKAQQTEDFTYSQGLLLSLTYSDFDSNFRTRSYHFAEQELIKQYFIKKLKGAASAAL
jgi:hypothetical protein